MTEPVIDTVLDGEDEDEGPQSSPWRVLGDPASLVERAARAALIAAAARDDVMVASGCTLAVLLTDDEAVRALNRDWRGLDKPTNVLSFPAVDPDELEHALHLGDIALAYETTAREAETEGKSLADHATHLVVHGVLHLIGYDHETEDEAQAMESLETQILLKLGIADPYAGDSPSTNPVAPGARAS